MSGFNLSAFGVRERALTLFLIVMIACAGTLAYFRLGRGEDPTFAVKVMTITLVWPGATADELQRQAGDRLEKRLQELTWYDRVETESRPGQLTMKLYLRDFMPPAQLQEEFYQARKKLSDEAVNLPRGVIGPIFNDEYSDVYFSLYALAAKDLPHRALVLQAEDVREQLLRIAGVLKVNIIGEQAQQIFVEISYRRLATLGISAQTLFNALASQNDVTPAGFVETKGPRIYLRVDGAIDNVDTIRDIPINAGGRTLKIGDIAEVHRGYVDPPSLVVRNDGERALLLGVVMKPGFNGLALGKALAEKSASLQRTLPVGMRYTQVSDQSKVIAEAIDEFMIKFFTALTVVIVVSLIALGLRVGLVVATAIPLTLAAVFVIMMATGRDFDRITLGALIISLGLLVDDAIISVEMMVVKMEEGLDRIAAATYAWGATAAPMLSGTLVTIAGFIPVGFARSTAGEYAGNIFWVVAFSLLTSWVVAVYFVPYIGVKMLPAIKVVKGGHAAIYATRNYEILRRIIRACVDHKWIVAGLTIAVFMMAVVGMGSVMKQFFPNSDRPELSLEVYLPPGASFASTETTVSKIEAAVRAQPEAKDVTSYVGAGTARFILSLDPLLPNPAYAQIIVRTDDAKARDALKERLRAMVADGRFPEARVNVRQFVFGPPVHYPVLFRVVGPNLDRVRAIAEKVRDIVAMEPDMVDAHLDWGQLTPTLHLVLDQERLRLIGLTPKDAALQLQALLNGNPVTQVRENLRSVDVLVRSPDIDRHAIQGIDDLTLTTSQGVAVPLSQVAHLETRMETAELKRYDRETYIAVEGDVRDGVQPPDVTAKILPTLEAVKASLPEGYHIDTGGAVEEAAKANAALVAVFPLMLVATLTILMLQVRSFSTMFMVFATAPLGLVGAVPTLLVFHQAFGFNAILGLIGLSGILMRNTLILVDQIRHDKADGLSDYEAIIESTVRRARPVILTALAAMLAFIPLTQSTFWGALAYVLIGGVGVGTILTLLFLPALYALWFRVKRDPAPADAQAALPPLAVAQGT
jgi:multidrug efflux pump subunit AcrB